jgi:hypothetical protein
MEVLVVSVLRRMEVDIIIVEVPIREVKSEVVGASRQIIPIISDYYQTQTTQIHLNATDSMNYNSLTTMVMPTLMVLAYQEMKMMILMATSDEMKMIKISVTVP